MSRGAAFPIAGSIRTPADLPFIGSFEGGGFFEDFDFQNECTAQFIRDVCRYWIDSYKIDGIRFDYVRGFFRESGPSAGISRIVRDLNAYAAG